MHPTIFGNSQSPTGLPVAVSVVPGSNAIVASKTYR